MNEFAPPHGRGERSRVERVSSVIHALTDHIRHENPSEHFTGPVETPPTLPEAPSERLVSGWDMQGIYHFPSEHYGQK